MGSSELLVNGQDKYVADLFLKGSVSYQFAEMVDISMDLVSERRNQLTRGPCVFGVGLLFFSQQILKLQFRR